VRLRGRRCNRRIRPRRRRVNDMRVPRCIGISCLAVALGGCAGYNVGPSNGLTAGEKSVQIVPFSNQTLEPRLGDALTSALRKELQRDGTYKLATQDTGDIVVS